MDCSKSWNLMMKKIDGAATAEEEQRLNDHIHVCSTCAGEYNVLTFALSSIKEVTPSAPEKIEKSVMTKLSHIKQKERISILPYALAPFIVVMGVLAVYLLNNFRLNPVAMMDDIARFLTSGYKLITAIVAVCQYLLRVLHLRELFVIVILIGLVTLAAGLVNNIRKNPTSGIRWRASK